MPAPDSVLKLCETFADHREHFRSGNYNEFQLRKQFLDPLFEALGWDMANSQGLAPQYRDVIHEDAIKIGPHVKAPDYAFTLHGQRKFFLEAKKPSVNIKADVAPAYQLRRYAWSAKLPLSILSDFEEFAIYDTRIKPAPNDPPAKARTFYCTYDQYAEKWDEIAAIFARDAILKGSFDKYADSAKKKKGTAEVDTAFLEEIERWRDLLARNFALRNPSLNVRDLNFAVQKTIDRLVFLRICEDRGTEDYGRLRTVANGTQTYPRLLELFRAADARYNSGLFHFSKEKGQAEEPDTLTPNLALDDKTLKDIIAHLYYPDSPYEFSVLPADILGSVYERFLGKTIRLTDGHQAKIEEKPEVRKAGGVYYTPSYIVDYIVQNTLGVLLEPVAAITGRRSSDPSAETAATDDRRYISLTDAAKLKVVDPACGSGSFLIVAYQYLLDWHRDRYAENPEKWSKGKNATLYQAKGDEWRLTTAEKKRILLNNIHGVDIDAAAVEVTKLSLLLKVLEGETGEIAQRDFLKERERILPDLSCNIKCGNSLIGPDFYDQPEMDLLDDEARFRVNVFDWKTAFPEVFKQGGFDAVIGNPPYVRIQTLPTIEVRYLSNTFTSSSVGNYDLYVSFVEKAHSLIRNGGLSGFIVPNKFLRTDYGVGLRRLLSNAKSLKSIVDFGAEQVFEATIYTCIIIVAKSGQSGMKFGTSEASERALHEVSLREILLDQFCSEPWTFQTTTERNLKAKLVQQSVRLLDLPAGMGRGSSTGDDNVFVIEGGAVEIEAEALRDPLFASDFGRYEFRPAGRWKVIFPYQVEGGCRLLSEGELKTRWPMAYRHLKSHEAALRKRKQFKDWFGFSAPRNLEVHERAHIAVPLLANRGLFSMIPEDQNGHLCPMASGGFTITVGEGVYASPKFVLGVLNSSLLFWCLRGISNVFRGGWITCTKQYVGELPIKVINPSSPTDVERHDRMVSLVDRMLDLVPKRRAEANPQAAAQLDAQIAATDRQIDRLVYDLYGLTDDEIALVEGA